MTSADEYTTVAGRVETEIEIERSRFLCVLDRSASEDAARAVVAEARAAHPRARHHCSAFRIGPRGETARSNDDGEPSGTAGLPMLEALRGEGLTDVVAVVTRYFGGVLLGTGGLVRAYTAAVQESAAAARRVVRAPRTRLHVDVGWDRGPGLEAELRRTGLVPVHVEYGEALRIDLAVAPGDVGATVDRVAELSSGAAGVDVGCTAYVDLPG
ncbi:IMPACT family protein [Luteimicrobium subarcticum]|nr:YigZ family protein [Luteimicrobium subarcticum]